MKQTSQKERAAIKLQMLLFLQHKLKHNYASDAATMSLRCLCAKIQGFYSCWMEVPSSM